MTTFQEDQLRDATTVANRCLVLQAVIAAGHGHSKNKLMHWLQKEGLWHALSPKEADFLQDPTQDSDYAVAATWRVEALYPLLWALKHVSTLQPPTELCDVPTVLAFLPEIGSSIDGFVVAAGLRDEETVFDAADEIVKIHWGVRDARIHGKPIPSGYNPEVVFERHYALNWLTSADGHDWDNVTTDT